MRLTRLLRLAALALLLPMGAQVQAAEPQIGVAFSKGDVVITVPKGVHIKKSFTEVRLEGAGKLKVGPLPKADAKDELNEDIYHGTVRIPVTGEGLSGESTLVMQYQVCTEGEGGNCFPPTEVNLKVKAVDLNGKVTPGSDKAKPEASAQRAEIAIAPPLPAVSVATVPVKAEVPAPAPEEKGLLLGLLVAFIAGLGASLTPCVYPMIPITMAIIGAKGGGKLKGFSLSLALVLGMAVTYTALGIVAARSGATFGSFAQKPAFLIPVSVLFALFALSLFGLFEINLPQGLQRRLQGDVPRKGFIGAFIMGLVLGPLAAPCVGPIIGTVLVGIAQKGSMVSGGLQLFVFALGMGVLFLIVGTFSAGLPRSGDWLTKVKYLMGVIVLGFAAWNIRLLAPEWLNAAMWVVVLLVAAVVLGAFKSAEDLGEGLQKGVGLTLLTIGILLGVQAVEVGLDLRLLPKPGVATKAEPGAQLWIENDLEAARIRAKAEHKLVLIDTFTSWCAQCKELDHKTWPNPEVVSWIQKNAIAVRVECEKARPDLQKTLEIKAYPTVILQDAEGKELRRAFGFKSPDTMLAWLNNR